MIRIENLNKAFGKRPVLRGIEVAFSENQVVAVIGPNASGKTTLIKCLLGLVIPDSGDIYFMDKAIGRTSAYRQHIGYMPQIGHYPDYMTVRNLFEMMDDIRFRNLDFGLGIDRIRKSKIQNPKSNDEELFEAFHLEEIFDKPMHTLSGGTKQKVGAALTFRYKPSVIILDEPTAGLDPLSAEILKDKIQKEQGQGKLILITSHVLSDLDDLASHVLYLQEGQIQFFKPLSHLQNETGEQKLGKIIAQIQKSDKRKPELSASLL